jgi:hypothetical protein
MVGVKKKSVSEKLSDAAHSVAESIDHALHPNSESFSEGEVDLSKDLADQSNNRIEESVEVVGLNNENGVTGNYAFDQDADQDHAKFDKFK